MAKDRLPEIEARYVACARVVYVDGTREHGGEETSAEGDMEQLIDEVKRLREALDDAACSLEAIARKAGKDDLLMEMIEIRGYAASRAGCARAVFAKPEREEETDG